MRVSIFFYFYCRQTKEVNIFTRICDRQRTLDFDEFSFVYCEFLFVYCDKKVSPLNSRYHGKAYVLQPILYA